MTLAIVVGAHGQDGKLLCEQLQRGGNTAVGLGRGDIDLLDRVQIENLLRAHRPDEIYYLAAHHHSSQDAVGSDDAGLFRCSFDVHVNGLLGFLEAMRTCHSDSRLFYAASCHMFGRAEGAVQNEKTPFRPVDVYGITKTAGVHCCRYYRNTHGIFASTGILYNHESCLRSPKFVSQKIVQGVRAILAGRQERLVLGDLSARVDWGYAPDFVDAMRRVLALPAADDFVVATGESHTVQEFVEVAFAAAGLDWRQHVVEDQGRLTRRFGGYLGDASKLRSATGWAPTVSFREMVRLLLGGPAHD